MSYDVNKLCRPNPNQKVHTYCSYSLEMIVSSKVYTWGVVVSEKRGHFAPKINFVLNAPSERAHSDEHR